MHQQDAESPSILKLLFGRTQEGKFEIEAFIPLYLKPSGDDKESFFKVRDDMVTANPNYISTTLSTLGQSIVPIVAIMPNERIRCLGTGFFVSADGLMITAAHVMIDPIERSYGGVRPIGDNGWYMGDLNLGVMIMTNPVFQKPGWIFRKIEWASLLAEHTESPLPFGKSELKLTTDTAICKVEGMINDQLYQPLAIIQPGLRGVGLAVGKSAMAIGYGAMQDVEIDGDGNMTDDLNFDIYVATGTILERFPDNLTDRQVKTPGPCFSASLRLPGGMSGSPIFDDERIYVHGVVSSGIEEADGPADFGYGSMLASSMQIPIKLMADKTLVDLLSEGDHGMPKLSIPDA